MRKICSGDRENLLKFEAGGQELAKVSNSERSNQFFETECFFNLFLKVFQIQYIRTIRIKIGKENL